MNLNIQYAVPRDGSILFKELAQKTGVDQDLLARVLRYSMTNGIFAESPQGHVRHTAASAALFETPLNNAIKWSTGIQLFSDLRLYEAIDSTRSNTTLPKAPFNIAYDTSDTMWDYQAKDKYLDELFSANMATEFGSAEMTPRHLAMGYDWDKLGSGTVVDVSPS